MSQKSLPPTGFRPLAPGDVPTERDIIINSPEGMPYIGPRESIGLPPAQKPVGMGDLYPPEPGMLEKTVQFGKKHALPAALPMIGGALGAGVGNQVAPGVGGVVGGSVGSMAGEGANQALGITEPSVTQIGMAGAMPMIPAALRRATTYVPGAEAGLHQLASKTAKGLVGRLAGSDYDALYETAKRAGASIPKGPIAQAGATARMREDLVPPAVRLGKVGKAIRGIDELLAGPGPALGPAGSAPDIPFENVVPTLQRYGEMYRAAARKGGPEKLALGELYAGLSQAIDDAARTGKGPGVAALREANVAFKRHLAHGELEAAVAQARTSVGGHRGANYDTIFRKLEPGQKLYDQLVKWVPKEEVDEIAEGFGYLAKIPPVSPAGRGGIGGTQFASRAVVTGGLAGLGLQLGGVGGAAAGVLAAEGVTLAMMSPLGRAVVRAVANSKLGGKGLAVDQVINAALQLARASTTTPGPTVLGRTAREDDEKTGLSMEGQR